ncbi:type II toxin-antitoxin system death-on-curing family toxin [Schleiferilactobacillus shenzhenensis]|uniref:Fido domain-containing protein n=1 Tax=Schleiferilactobacillus shenzhenensis LY-73 TaxID=1231336 RepID=U4TUV0_9LACO|nr:type II toxin-antitoxin system death-on-curing family toxin [Schleiferilactobacillus shenzhenensis]ERL65648.1 hypothetical protein L248_2334 [Schleiferilactobacillus shenzhenensis LY-73]
MSGDRKNDLVYPTEADLVAINQWILQAAGETGGGVQYPPGLDLVVTQPQMTLFGEEMYPTVWLKAAYILQKITKKHVFTDGNKRTALAAAAAFLHVNGFDLVQDEEEGIRFVLYVTTEKDSEEVMLTTAEWLKAHSQSITK